MKANSPPKVDRIWLRVHYSKIPIYPIFYLPRGEYRLTVLLNLYWVPLFCRIYNFQVPTSVRLSTLLHIFDGHGLLSGNIFGTIFNYKRLGVLPSESQVGTMVYGGLF